MAGPVYPILGSIINPTIEVTGALQLKIKWTGDATTFELWRIKQTGDFAFDSGDWVVETAQPGPGCIPGNGVLNRDITPGTNPVAYTPANVAEFDITLDDDSPIFLDLINVDENGAIIFQRIPYNYPLDGGTYPRPLNLRLTAPESKEINIAWDGTAPDGTDYIVILMRPNKPWDNENRREIYVTKEPFFKFKNLDENVVYDCFVAYTPDGFRYQQSNILTFLSSVIGSAFNAEGLIKLDAFIVGAVGSGATMEEGGTTYDTGMDLTNYDPIVYADGNKLSNLARSSGGVVARSIAVSDPTSGLIEFVGGVSEDEEIEIFLNKKPNT